MARKYEVLFRARATYDSVRIIAEGNTKNSAVRAARRTLRYLHGKNPDDFYMAKIAFAGRNYE